MEINKTLCGRISYINVLPLYYPLEEHIIPHTFHFISAPPSLLNQKIQRAELDLSPVSSVEYIMHPSLYYIIPDIAITAFCDVMSVLLFSHYPIEDLHNKTIGMTSESNTSVLLLQLLLKARFSILPSYRNINQQSIHNHDAVLLIGDSALSQASQGTYQYIYDLGRLWNEWTNLPFVFALWVIPASQKKQSSHIALPFYEARKWSERNKSTIENKAKEISGLTDKTLKSYYSCLGYSLGKSEQESLSLFIELLYEYNYCKERVMLHFV